MHLTFGDAKVLAVTFVINKRRGPCQNILKTICIVVKCIDEQEESASKHPGTPDVILICLNVWFVLFVPQLKKRVVFFWSWSKTGSVQIQFESFTCQTSQLIVRQFCQFCQCQIFSQHAVVFARVLRWLPSCSPSWWQSLVLRQLLWMDDWLSRKLLANYQVRHWPRVLQFGYMTWEQW